MKAKAGADVLLFVIAGATRGVASIAEVSYLLAAGRPLSFVVDPAAVESEQPGDADHVHRVLDPTAPRVPFVFGESKWERKGLGRWCYRRDCCGESVPRAERV